MSDNKDQDIHKLASDFLDLWQKQLTAQSTDRAVNDGLKLAGAFNEQAAAFMKTMDTPQKAQTWMQSWSESWKEQFKDGTDPFAAFTQGQTHGAATAAPASEHPEHNVDELSRRITLLEERVRELESRLEGKS